MLIQCFNNRLVLLAPDTDISSKLLMQRLLMPFTRTLLHVIIVIIKRNLKKISYLYAHNIIFITNMFNIHLHSLWLYVREKFDRNSINFNEHARLE